MWCYVNWISDNGIISLEIAEGPGDVSNGLEMGQYKVLI